MQRVPIPTDARVELLRDGAPDRRTCLVPVTPGMILTRQSGKLLYQPEEDA